MKVVREERTIHQLSWVEWKAWVCRMGDMIAKYEAAEPGTILRIEDPSGLVMELHKMTDTVEP